MLIGFLNADDALHDSATKAIGGALSANQTLAMSASELAEILVGPSRSGAKAVEVVRNMAATLPLEVVPIAAATEEGADRSSSNEDHDSVIVCGHAS